MEDSEVPVWGSSLALADRGVEARTGAGGRSDSSNWSSVELELLETEGGQLESPTSPAPV